MVTLEYKILKAAFAKYGMNDQYINVQPLADDPSEAFAAALGLAASGLLSKDRRDYFAITSAGISAMRSMENQLLRQAQEEAADQAKEKKADRLERKAARRSWYQLFIGALLGWLLSGIFSAQDFFHWIVSLFH